MGIRVLRRVLRRRSKKGLSRRHLECRNTPFREYDPLGVRPTEGHVRHLDVSQQKQSPYFLGTIFDSQLPSPKLSPKTPPKLPLAHKKRLFLPLSKLPPPGEGYCETIERQKLSLGNFCLKTSRCLCWPTGDFCQRPDLEWKFLLRRTWSGQKLLPLQFPGLSAPY